MSSYLLKLHQLSINPDSFFQSLKSFRVRISIHPAQIFSFYPGTIDIVNRYRHSIATVVSEPDHGIYDAMNKGISLATGDVIGFLNADDFFYSNDVLQQISSVMQDQAFDGCYADLVYVSKDQTDNVVRYWKSCPYRDGLFERGWMPAHPTFYVRREVYLDHGGYNLDYKFHSDEELAARFMAVKKIKTCYVSEPWVRMRLGGATNRSLANIVKGSQESIRALGALGLNISPFYFITKFSMRIKQYFKRGPDPA